MKASSIEADFRAAVLQEANRAGIQLAGGAIKESFGLVNAARGTATLCFRIALKDRAEMDGIQALRMFKRSFNGHHGGSQQPLRVECVLSGALIRGKAHDWTGARSEALA